MDILTDIYGISKEYKLKHKIETEDIVLLDNFVKQLKQKNYCINFDIVLQDSQQGYESQYNIHISTIQEGIQLANKLYVGRDTMKSKGFSELRLVVNNIACVVYHTGKLKTGLNMNLIKYIKVNDYEIKDISKI